MSIQSIEQLRAQYALEKITALPVAEHKEWLSRANEMPAMIQMNGLGQTVAFYLSKGGTHKKMYDLLSKWLCDNQNAKLSIYKNHPDLMQGIAKGDLQSYRAAQAEAQALLIWVKKLSKAFCKGEE